MSVYHPHTVQCVCGNSLVVQLADSINAKRSPDARERILRGELHRAKCPACSREMTVEKPFYYTDLGRNLLFKVLPRGERHTWKSASIELDRASAFIPASLVASEGRTLRTVFGMDELREKLLAQEAALDDRVLELLKVMVVHDHPVLLRRPRLRLVLDHVTDDALEFAVAYEHDPRRFRVRMPRGAAASFAADPERLTEWTSRAHRESVFALSDHWVNMWRWSPQPSALDQLQGYAADLDAGREIDVSTPAFDAMLSGLPRGAHLPTWAKQALKKVFDYAKARGEEALEDRLFEIRFGVMLEDDWSQNADRDDIDTLWQLLKDLPDNNVEGNTKINEILLDMNQGGGAYNPRTHDISIGSNELGARERFEDVVRHEVGHAVHEMKEDLVNVWLHDRFGWRIFGVEDDEIDQWVALMGGWGPLSASEQRAVRDALRTAVGNGSSWSPGPLPTLPQGHPWYGSQFGPRLAFESTGERWFRNFRTWHRINGKAFFLNFWYRTFMAVDTAALDLVARMPDAYASMSHYEFFAEMYALYYDLDDPLRANVPADVAQWIDTNIGAPEVAAPMPGPPRRRREWEDITRPRTAKPPARRSKGKTTKPN